MTISSGRNTALAREMPLFTPATMITMATIQTASIGKKTRGDEVEGQPGLVGRLQVVVEEEALRVIPPGLGHRDTRRTWLPRR